MKLKLTFLTMVSLGVAFALTSCSISTETAERAIDREADEEAIRSLLRANWAAGTAKNPSAVAATYTIDGDAWIAGLTRVSTQDSIREAEEEYGGLPGFQSYDGTIETIRFISRDAAIVEFTGITTLDSGKFNEETTVVAARSEDGWKIAAWRVMNFDETLLKLLQQ